MGRAELNKVSSLLTQVLVHLLKLAADPQSPARAHWIEEILTFQADARRAFTPGMRQRLDLSDLWRDSSRRAVIALTEAGLAGIVAPAACPLTLDTLLDRDFDHAKAITDIASLLSAPERH